MTEESEVTKITYTSGNRKFSIIQIEFNINRSKQIVAHITSFSINIYTQNSRMQRTETKRLAKLTSRIPSMLVRMPSFI